MSEKSLYQTLRWKALSGPAYRGLRLVLAQSVPDAQRFLRLGCQDVRVVGNIKFDVAVSDQARQQALLWQSVLAARPVVMLASTRQGEEFLWLQALQSQPARLEKFKALGVLWLLVPRHPQRFDEVHDLLELAQLHSERRSAWGDHEPDPARMAIADAILGDSLGEMQAYYLISRMALLGGSFAPLGGQNLIEAAACACPLVMGPNTFNFSEAAAMAVEQGAAVQVQDMQAALDHVVLALTQPKCLEHAKTAAVQLLKKGQGAVPNHIKALCSMAATKRNGEVA